MLRERCGLRGSVYVNVEEKVAMFLLVVGHGLKMRLLRGTYKRSLGTISTHFSAVLNAILSMHGEFIKLPDANVQPPDDYKWKWFGDALGALDGCHVDVSVPVAAQGRYRNRKQDVSTNMLGVVDWNMKFLYVLPGWEGSASDSRVLRDSMRTDRQDAFVVPHGMAFSLGILFSLIYSDASWRKKNIPGRAQGLGTGIGVFIHISGHEIERKIMIQASTSDAHSPLCAEALALQLAARVVAKLQIQQATFFTDNLSLAKMAASRNINDDSINWRCRTPISNFLQDTSSIQTSIYHIIRNINGIAHDCSHQVLNSRVESVFSCTHSSQSNSLCPTLLYL